MSEGKLARPPQATAAAWLVMVGSVLVVLMAFSRVADVRSLETREAIEDYLSRPPGDTLDLGVQGVQRLLQVASMVAAACAAATAILGYWLLQRSRSSLIALSVLAVPLFVSGLVSGGIASSVVVAAVVMLWFQPARDWFNGVARTSAPAPVAPAAPAWPPPVPQRDPRLDDLPPPQGPPAYPSTYGPRAGATPPAVAGRRPPAVLWACVLTWTFSTLAFGVLALVLGLMIASPHLLLDEAHRQNPDLGDEGVTDAVLRTTVCVMAVVVMVWAAAAAAFAVLAWRRVRWAAAALLVSAGCAGGLCLLFVIGSLTFVVPLAACAATVALLVRAEVRRWYAGA